MSAFTLRKYQNRFCNQVVRAFAGTGDAGPFTKVLATAATGAGKTIIASALIKHWTAKEDAKCLFIVDTNELCSQSVDKLWSSRGIVADLEKAESRASKQSPVVVASIQSLSTRLADWPTDHFDYVIADEAHMSLAAGWQRTLKHFHGGGAKVLGITATPERGDKKSLMRFYEHVAAEIPLAELIVAKHLSPITVETVPLQITIKSKVTEGDNEALGEEMKAYYKAIIDAVAVHAPDRKKFLWFHPSVAASTSFAQLLGDRGEDAEHVDGTSFNRTDILDRFAAGKFRHLNNCAMLTKGYDCPDIDCVVILRPTKSRTLYIQMAGRGTRLYCPHGCTEWCDHADRKQNLKLLDFLWAFNEHDVMGPADIITDAPEQRAALAEVLRKGGDLDLLDSDRATSDTRQERLLEALKSKSGRAGYKLDALQWCALLRTPELLDYESFAPWQKEKPTERQIEVLTTKAGISAKAIRDRGHASALMNAYVHRITQGLATPKQALYLLRENVESPSLLSFEQATVRINELKNRTAATAG